MAILLHISGVSGLTELTLAVRESIGHYDCVSKPIEMPTKTALLAIVGPVMLSR